MFKFFEIPLKAGRLNKDGELKMQELLLLLADGWTIVDSQSTFATIGNQSALIYILNKK